MKAAERDHIEEFGEEKFERALIAARMEIRKSSKLVGLDKIREPLALAAAFHATGHGEHVFSLGRNIEITAAIYEICTPLLKDATEAARATLPAAVSQ